MSTRPPEADPDYRFIYNRRSGGQVFRQVRIDGDPDLVDRMVLLAEAFQVSQDDILDVLSDAENIMLGKVDLPEGRKHRESVLRERLEELGVSKGHANTLLGQLIREVTDHIAARRGGDRYRRETWDTLYERMNSAPTASEGD